VWVVEVAMIEMVGRQKSVMWQVPTSVEWGQPYADARGRDIEVVEYRELVRTGKPTMTTAKV